MTFQFYSVSLYQGPTHLLNSIRGQGSRQVLLVCKDEEGRSSQALGKERTGWGSGGLEYSLIPSLQAVSMQGQEQGSTVVGEPQVG